VPGLARRSAGFESKIRDALVLARSYPGAMTEQDYVLGTNDEELARLGLQHEVWRPHALEAWRRAGITAGSYVLDIGSGPGYASFDLADLVGPGGRVLAIERSARFAEAVQRRASPPLEVVQMDLMAEPIEADKFDAAWCRWVACFVASPSLLVARIASALRPGGRLVMHEYVDYATWRLVPPRPRFEAFVAEVMASWRDSGGEPNIARSLPEMFPSNGLVIRHATPLVFAARPGQPMWRWPAAFLRTGAARLHALGRVDSAWVESVVRTLDDAELDPDTIMVTPLVLELIAERAGSRMDLQHPGPQ
jgi:SAM-dependent methyltransferase